MDSQIVNKISLVVFFAALWTFVLYIYKLTRKQLKTKEIEPKEKKTVIKTCNFDNQSKREDKRMEKKGWNVVVYKNEGRSYVRIVAKNGTIVMSTEANGYKHWWHAVNIGNIAYKAFGGNIKFYPKGLKK